jgi:hypothetical protein
MTDSIDHEQMVLWCKAYPHAENKARKLGYHNFYLTEMGRDTHPGFFDSLADYVENLRHKPGSSSWARVKPGMKILPFDDRHPAWYFRTAHDAEPHDSTYHVTAGASSYSLDDLLPTYRVLIHEVDPEVWMAGMEVPLTEEDSVEMYSTHPTPFYAYLNVVEALNKFGLAGFVEPEFEPNGKGRGFYGLPSEQERMPLKANGGS